MHREFSTIERSALSPADLLARTPPESQQGGGPGGFASGPDPSPGMNSPQYLGAVSIALEQLNRLLRASWRYGRILQKPFTVGVTADTLLPVDQERRYLFILNIHAANTLWIGFDAEPNATGQIGLPLAANNGFYEPLVTPTNQIYIVGSGAGTNGICLYVSGS